MRIQFSANERAAVATSALIGRMAPVTSDVAGEATNRALQLFNVMLPSDSPESLAPDTLFDAEVKACFV